MSMPAGGTIPSTPAAFSALACALLLAGLPSAAAAVECLQCVTPGGATIWTPQLPGNAGQGPRGWRLACQGVGATPGAGKYTLRTAFACGAPCSNADSDCGGAAAPVGTARCDSDWIADDIETCIAVAAPALFECDWNQVSCCTAAPPVDTCTLAGTPAVPTCGGSACNQVQRWLGALEPEDEGGYVALVAVVFLAGIAMGGLVLRASQRRASGGGDASEG